MNWINIKSVDQLHEIKEKSKTRTQVIFKHSIRCSISGMAKSRLERSAQPNDIDFYYLDLINFRNISSKVADVFDVWHESPQVLVIKNGVCVYDESHSAIRMEDILENV